MNLTPLMIYAINISLMLFNDLFIYVVVLPFFDTSKEFIRDDSQRL